MCLLRMIELKPCPFCGESEHLVSVQDKTHVRGGGCYVICDFCEIAGPETGTEKSAVYCWNQRPTPDNTIEEKE